MNPPARPAENQDVDSDWHYGCTICGSSIRAVSHVVDGERRLLKLADLTTALAEARRALAFYGESENWDGKYDATTDSYLIHSRVDRGAMARLALAAIEGVVGAAVCSTCDGEGSRMVAPPPGEAAGESVDCPTCEGTGERPAADAGGGRR